MSQLRVPGAHLLNRGCYGSYVNFSSSAEYKYFCVLMVIRIQWHL